MILLEGVAKRYGELEAVAPVTLTIEKGETVAVLGPSGGGKTTLLLMMTGALQPSEGRVLLDGTDIAAMKPGPELARLVGMIHQQFDLVPHLSTLHNVLAGNLGRWGLRKAMVSLVWPRDRWVALKALDKMGVADRASYRAARLSGGEQQRVAIARLLVQDPALILADEPVASLDPARAGEVLSLLLSAKREGNKTLVASIHSVDLARQHFERLIGLRNGVVTFDLPTTKVTAQMLTELYGIQGLRDET